MMRRSSPFPPLFLIAMSLPLFGCSTVKPLWDKPIIETKVEYIKQELNCGPEPKVDALVLLEYEPIVLPSLSVLGVTPDLLPDWLVEHFDHGWIALSDADWEDVDRNDIDKLRYARQLRSVIDFYRSCVDG